MTRRFSFFVLLAAGAAFQVLPGKEPFSPAAVSATAPASSSMAVLTGLIIERLNWMDEVAEVKRAKDTPVADPQREEALLQAMEKQAQIAGLKPEAVRRFFEGQIEAAKAFQTEWLARPKPAEWENRPLPDLAKEVRPHLDAIGQRMIVALVKAGETKVEETDLNLCREALMKAGFSEAVVSSVMTGVRAGCGAP